MTATTDARHTAKKSYLGTWAGEFTRLPFLWRKNAWGFHRSDQFRHWACQQGKAGELFE